MPQFFVNRSYYLIPAALALCFFTTAESAGIL
jgi:hypothetical protein